MRTGVFDCQYIWKGNSTKTIGDIVFVEQLNMAKIAVQFLLNSIRQYSNAIFGSLFITNDDLVLAEINVLDTQTNALHKAQAAAVEQLGHQPVFS